MIFVDTSFFLTVLSDKEKNHSLAMATLDAYEGRDPEQIFLTTNHVIFETVTLARRRADHALAAAAAEKLWSKRMATIHRPTPDQESRALQYLIQHDDKNYSSIDCLSFVVMEDLGIREALTFDDDFSHRFVMLPGPQ